MSRLPFRFFLRAIEVRTSRRPRVRAALTARAVPLLAALTAANTARAAAYEGFDYPVRAAPSTWTGGTGFASGWTTSNTFPNVAAGSLSDPTGTLATSGNRVEYLTEFSLNRLSNDRPGTAGGEYWVSFLMRRGNNSQGFSGLLFETSWSPNSGQLPMTGKYFIGEPSSGAGDGTFVVSNTNDPQAVSTGVPLVAGQDYFLVTRFRIDEGNDPATLWVNPTPGVLPSEATGVTFTGSNFGNDFPWPRFVNSIYGPGGVSVDELRTGGSYAEVAPAVPEPAAPVAALAALTLLARRRRRCIDQARVFPDE